MFPTTPLTTTYSSTAKSYSTAEERSHILETLADLGGRIVNPNSIGVLLDALKSRGYRMDIVTLRSRMVTLEKRKCIKRVTEGRRTQSIVLLKQEDSPVTRGKKRVPKQIKMPEAQSQNPTDILVGKIQKLPMVEQLMIVGKVSDDIAGRLVDLGKVLG